MSLLKGGNSAAWTSPPAPIYPLAAQFADSLSTTAVTVNGVNTFQVNSHARLVINVPAGTTSLTAWIANDLFGSTFEVGIGVYVDGVWSTSFSPADTTSAASLAPYALSLNGAAHTVTLWAGYNQKIGSAVVSTYVYAVQGVGISIGTVPTVTRRMACYGDSIMEGGASSPSAQLSWFALMRGIYPGAMSMEAFGGRGLWDDCGSGAGQLGFASVTLLAQRLVGLNFGVSTREYWLAIGINDVGGNFNAAQFEVNYAALLDAIHLADSSGRIYCQTMLTNQGAYTTAISTAAAGRAYCTVVDGTALLTAGGLSGDGTHPTNAGHQAYALGTGAFAGTTSVRAVLGV